MALTLELVAPHIEALQMAEVSQRYREFPCAFQPEKQPILSCQQVRQFCRADTTRSGWNSRAHT